MSEETDIKPTENEGGFTATGGSGLVPHSPGPWKASKGHDGEPDRWCVVAAKGAEYYIAVIENGQPGDCCETEGATARLIAAAPDMLDALRDADAALEHMGEVLNDMDAVTEEDQKYFPAFGKVRAAIAKALGQNN